MKLYNLRKSRRSAAILDVVRLKKLDDGWPESVEEQSLLLLVWRHSITR